MNLYELTGERLALQNKLESMNFDEETINDTLEANSTELEAKIEGYGWIIRNMESFTDAMKAEEVRMAERRKAHEKSVTNIKAWLLQNMQLCGITKIECPAFAITVKNNPPSVVIDDEALIPESYKKLPEPPPLVANKTMIGTALKSGLDVPGCHLEQKQRVEIK